MIAQAPVIDAESASFAASGYEDRALHLPLSLNFPNNATGCSADTHLAQSAGNLSLHTYFST
jgi:hypothetical protein